jgi:hypothetical protein
LGSLGIGVAFIPYYLIVDRLGAVAALASLTSAAVALVIGAVEGQQTNPG